MNAHTPFRLESQSISLLSRLDLSDPDNVKDCAHALRRCREPGDFEVWAQAWGEKLLGAAEFFATHDSDDFVSAEEMKDVERDCERAEASLQELKTAVERAETALDRLSEDFDLGTKLSARIDGVVSALENARSEA